MALKIKPTPKLNQKDSMEFIERVESKVNVASYPIATPKLARFTKKLIKDASRMSQKSHK
ncbi:MAG: hypothetical protein JRF53_19125 [Deltaproteobacteria bacterium]|nr:hypothetical protein [Deltaproteobacteria bacterium]